MKKARPPAGTGDRAAQNTNAITTKRTEKDTYILTPFPLPVNYEKEIFIMTTTEKIIAYFNENPDIFTDCIEQLNNYNGYLGDDRIYDMAELPELVSTDDIFQLLNMAYFGNDDENWITENGEKKNVYSFNPNRDYFYFNGYGNLCSCDYKDYSAHLDHYAIEAMQENRDEIEAIDDNPELAELFDQLDEE